MKSTLLFLQLALGVASLASDLPVFSRYSRRQDVPTFDWDSIAPSTTLNWITCYSEATQCTRLSVPVNYSDPSAGDATIALVRIPSPLGLAGSPSYRGPVLINPGGPGGSGVEYVLSPIGSDIASVIGEEFDLVGFDPRGVANSTPRILSIFNNDVERVEFGLGYDDWNMEVSSLPTLPGRWARMQVFGRLAQGRDNGFLSHVTTDNVARDMMSIVSAHGREKLQYWGFSYGTVLGATFATLFPDNIERAILDGVLDLDGYYATEWINNIVDADKALQTFFAGCAAAGPDSCAFHSPQPSAIKQRLDALYKRVLRQPAPAYSPSFPQYGVLDYALLKSTIFIALYAPYQTFPTLAQALKLLEDGDASLLYQLAIPRGGETPAAVECADGKPVSDSPATLAEYAKQASLKSSFGSQAASVRLLCSGWKIHPNSFKGPITANTSHPLLIIGNTADPITPLAAAKQAVKAFPGSVLLTQDTPGHTSVAAPSECTYRHVRNYFLNGTLPIAGTICNVTTPLFPPRSTNGNDSTSVAIEYVKRGMFIV
ncbi:hypothetical protein NLJ89_g6589 [Agrocybe chaxingu]|uniref:Peptidase S33 tripeptidyl aminopeptidase-like C-terminal domain-containing protein n=1 Tax=Agrocybe chaxingu TaxID=84603 RepID=A0A9W8K0J0_9AGAR|nr:hypothetical protein NLJ89_g6589 [Agrocybe chaxingu]